MSAVMRVRPPPDSPKFMNIPFLTEPGWTGFFTRRQAEGAIPNGTRIVKACDEPGDAHTIGALGTILGSIGTPPEWLPEHLRKVKYAYFVEWDDMPKAAVGVMDFKITQLLPN